MSKTKTILKSLMEKAGHSPYDISAKTGIHPTTIYRLMDGQHKAPQGETAEKIALVYGITVSQLRGDAPLDGVEPPASHDLKELLTVPEYRHVTNMKKLSEEARGILYRLTEILVEEPGNSMFSEDREGTNSSQQLRVGQTLHKTPVKKKRIEETYDGRKVSRPNKASQRA